jgi:hypothetical protein
MPAERYPTKEMAEVEVYGRDGAVIARIQNLSETGACLQWDNYGAPVHQGDLVRLTVILRALRREHKVNAEVVWVEGQQTGIQFLSAKELLSKMIHRPTV